MPKLAGMSRLRVLGFFASFLMGVTVAALLPKFIRTLSNVLDPVPRKEIARITSPDNVVDAVVIEIGCGAPCSSTDLVFIVPKGKVPSDEPERAIFSADDLVGEKFSWTAPHLLEIAYTKALINRFTNVSYPLAVFGKEDTWNYVVEARLAPSSTGYSYIREENLR